jgi:cytochrome P450
MVDETLKWFCDSEQIVNIFPSPDQRLSPFGFYSNMRHLNPVAYDDANNVWGVFRYNDVQFILGDYVTFSSANNTFSRSLRPGLLQSDPPYHRTLRGVIASAFTPMMVAKLEPHIDKIANETMDRIIENGRMDLIHDFAYPLPVTIIAELLGVPIEDRELFHQWADILHHALNSEALRTSTGGAGISTGLGPTKNVVRIQEEMDSYFNAIIEKRTQTPREDLITNLIRAQADGRHLSREEILTFCRVLLVAGHVTTFNLIGNTILSLLQNPQEFKLLQENHSLIGSALEETLRYRSPVQAVNRVVTKDVKLGGQKIQSGQRIIAWIGSANHDESVFLDPERFDINRSSRQPNLAFGHGIHFCLGAPLARLEGQVVLRIILRRLQGLTLDGDSDHLQPLQSIFFHGVTHLPLRFQAAVHVK